MIDTSQLNGNCDIDEQNDLIKNFQVMKAQCMTNC